MEFRELLDRLAVLGWVDVVLVRHRPEARFVVHGIACDAEGTRVDEDESVVDEEGRRRIRLDHVDASQEFHRPARGSRRPSADLFLSCAALQHDATRRVLMGRPTYPPRVRSIALTDVLARVEAD